MRTLWLLAALVALPLQGVTGSPGHGSGDGVAYALHDGPDGGRAAVHGLTHLGFALVDPHGEPLVHRDAQVQLYLGGRLLFASNDTHEYDGHFSLDATFREAGGYLFVVTSDGLPNATFAGEAVAPGNATVPTIDLALAPTGGGVQATLRILDEGGAVIPHTDAVIEVRRKADLSLLSRDHLHIHNDPIVWAQGFPLGCDCVVKVDAYLAHPTGTVPDVALVTKEFPLAVAPAAPPVTPTAPPLPPPATEGLQSPMGARAKGEGRTLQAMIDPQALVGVGNQVRLSAMIANETGAPKPHVDFTFTLEGPRGLLYATESIHEYDGHFEHLFVPELPGAYEGTLVAYPKGQALTVPFRVQVAPPALPFDAGAHTVRLEGLEDLVAGIPSELTIRVADPAGRPLKHSEADVTVVDAEGRPAYRVKLHAHDEGVMRAWIAFPEQGAWKVLVDATALEPQAVRIAGPDGPGRPVVFTVDVAAGGPVSTPPGPDAAGEARQRVPFPSGFTLAALLAVALVSAGRRRAP